MFSENGKQYGELLNLLPNFAKFKIPSSPRNRLNYSFFNFSFFISLLCYRAPTPAAIRAGPEIAARVTGKKGGSEVLPGILSAYPKRRRCDHFAPPCTDLQNFALLHCRKCNGVCNLPKNYVVRFRYLLEHSCSPISSKN